MLDLMRDSIWQFIGVIIAIIAIIISIVTFFLQRGSKGFSYELISEISLFSVAREVKERVKVLFDDIPVHGVYLILIKFSNSGNVPILPTDYIKNIEILFSDKTKILSAEITDTSPQDIEGNIETKDSCLTLAPTLLNSGDSITIKILASEYDLRIKVSGRIIGVKEIQQKRNYLHPSTVVILALGFIVTIAGMIIGNTNEVLTRGLAILAIFLFIFPVSTDRKYLELIKNGFENLVKTMSLVSKFMATG